ncbi:MAG: TetR/AcrR family transcriptional regulator [Proteobacteria bacterium]|nr:TetR/AcrR family transcriptional regulator [Pseudomonadota bacterium]
MARPRQVSDEDILKAVREAVFEHGPSVSTSVIAERVGLSQAALFKRFGTKETLLIRGLAPTELLEIKSLISGPSASEPFRDQLTELATELHAQLRILMPRIAALRSCGFQPSKVFGQFEVPPPVRMVRALAGWFDAAKTLDMVRAEADSSTLAKALMGSLFFESHLNQVAEKWLPEPDPDQHVASVVELLCTSILVEGK